MASEKKHNIFFTYLTEVNFYDGVLGPDRLKKSEQEGKYSEIKVVNLREKSLNYTFQ